MIATELEFISLQSFYDAVLFDFYAVLNKKKKDK